MLMPELLKQYEITEPKHLVTLLHCSRALAWAYLHGQADIPRDGLIALHRAKGIPLDLLVTAKRKANLPRLGRPPKARPPAA